MTEDPKVEGAARDQVQGGLTEEEKRNNVRRLALIGRNSPVRIPPYTTRRGGAGREAPIASVIRSVAPDIVILEEATRPDVVERIARETAMTQWSSRAGKSLAFMSRVPIASF